MSYDEGIRPSQHALADLFCHEVEQSHDMKLMDSLVPVLVGDYGETHHAIYAYETEDYPLWSAPPDQGTQDTEKTDSGLPRQVTAGHFDTLKANSPFTRSINLSDLLILTGLATVDGKKVATLMN